MRSRVLIGTLVGSVVCIALVAGYSEIVRSCGRPSWWDAVRGFDAPKGLACDYFPSALESATNAILLGLFILVGGCAAGLIARRSSLLCGGGAALLGAVVIVMPPLGRAVAESHRLELPVSGLIAHVLPFLLIAAVIGVIGGAVVVKLWPNTSPERTREG